MSFKQINGKDILIVLVCLAIAGAMGFWFFFYSSPVITITSANETISFTKRDIDLATGQENCYRNGKNDSPASFGDGAVKLILLSFDKVAQKRLSASLTPSMLDQNENRITKETEAPTVLQCVKNVYTYQHQRYRDFFVEPELLNQVVRVAFNVSQDIHNSARSTIEDVRKQVSAYPSQFAQIGKEKNLWIRLSYPRPEGIHNPAIAEYISEQSSDPLVHDVLSKLKPGEVFPGIVDNDYSYQLIKLISVRENPKNKIEKSYTFERIVVMKTWFDDWYKKFITDTVHITLHDKTLYDKLRKAEPAAWWGKIVTVQ